MIGGYTPNYTLAEGLLEPADWLIQHIIKHFKSSSGLYSNIYE